jgi:uncharacterized protein (TIGR00255 family)
MTNKIQSMTGIGVSESVEFGHALSIEVKSVNSRFKDIRVRLPHQFSSLEMEVRKIIGESFKRGTFDVAVNLKKQQSQGAFSHIDEAKVREYVHQMSGFFSESKVEARVDICAFLRTEFYQEEIDNKEKMHEFFFATLKKSLTKLGEARVQEGQKLVVVVQDHLENFKKHLTSVEAEAGDYQKNVEQKLMKKIQDFSTEMNLDKPRYLQEVLYYMEKLDVHEELNRLKSHIQKFEKIMKGTNEVGKEVDFLLQEMNRETNTIGSKSGTEKVSHAVVAMKLQLEKMREQTLNLE